MSEPIEQLLQRQPLRQPTAELDRRVFAALAAEPVETPRRSRWMLALFPLGLAAAAAVAMAVTLNLPRDPAVQSVEVAVQPQPAGGGGEPVIEISQSWTESQPLGVLLVSDEGAALRAIRTQQVQQTRWVDPADGVAFEITAPIAEAQLVLEPANVY